MSGYVGKLVEKEVRKEDLLVPAENRDDSALALVGKAWVEILQIRSASAKAIDQAKSVENDLNAKVRSLEAALLQSKHQCQSLHNEKVKLQEELHRNTVAATEKANQSERVRESIKEELDKVKGDLLLAEGKKKIQDKRISELLDKSNKLRESLFENKLTSQAQIAALSKQIKSKEEEAAITLELHRAQLALEQQKNQEATLLLQKQKGEYEALIKQREIENHSLLNAKIKEERTRLWNEARALVQKQEAKFAAAWQEKNEIQSLYKNLVQETLQQEDKFKQECNKLRVVLESAKTDTGAIEKVMEDSLAQLRVEKQNLSEKFAKLNTEKQDLSEKLVQLNTEKQDLSEKLVQLNTEKQDLSEKLVQLNTEKQDFSEKLAQLDTEKQILSEKFALAERQKSALKEELVQQDEELQNLRETNPVQQLLKFKEIELGHAISARSKAKNGAKRQKVEDLIALLSEQKSALELILKAK